MMSAPTPAIRPEIDLANSGSSLHSPSLSTRLQAVLPQTQCARCGYPDCAAYADAMANGHADLNQCAPGGLEGVARLAAVLHRPVVPLNPDHGSERPRVLAVIDENWCIGCTKCLDACPTDAIVGASKRMHTVVSAHCTGCERCVPVCPVDCIETHDDSGMRTGWDAWSTDQASKALARYRNRSARLARQGRPGSASPAPEGRAPGPSPENPSGNPPPPAAPPPLEQARTALLDPKRALIDAALQRARARMTSKA